MRRPHPIRNSMKSRIVVEAERLLSGEAVEKYHYPARQIPAWSLVNTLAHNDRRGLEELTRRGASAHPGSWGATLGYLAHELNAMAPSGADLTELQRQLLVPLELQLLGGQVEVPTTPTRLAIMVSRALDKRQRQNG